MNSAISEKRPETASFPAPRPPVLILSSRAGLGNYAVGQAILARLAGTGDAFHYPVEAFLESFQKQEDFGRYRWICSHAPFLLHFIYRFPASYWFKKFRESRWPAASPKLENFLAAQKISTVIAANHRAAFWLSSLKKQGRAQCELWAVLTDYHVNSGWKSIFWEEVNRFLGSAAIKEVPRRMRPIYTRIPLPLGRLSSGFHTAGSKDHVLITGGAWGLGPIEKTVCKLRRTFSNLHLHVACGDNDRLRDILDRAYASDTRVHLYGMSEPFSPLMDRCAAIITKPGSVTLTEAHKSGRIIFLLPGLPVTEQANAHHAKRHFSARPFSLQTFGAWYHAR